MQGASALKQAQVLGGAAMLASPPLREGRSLRVVSGPPPTHHRTGEESVIRLLVVDDHAVVRLGLVSLFSTARNIQVVGEAASVAQAIVVARERHPDVVIMDARLPDGSGIDGCREIRSEHSETHVIILTAFADDDAVVGSILAGASGYLLKRTEPGW